MEKVYRIVGIDRNGEIVEKSRTVARNPEIAMLSVDSVRGKRMVARLALERRAVLPGTWTDHGGWVHERYGDSVIEAIEPNPGDWTAD